MTLFWPDHPATIPQGQPLLHALVIGVGDYPHLSGGVGHPAVKDFGLQQLTTTTKTAARIANWFVSAAKPPIPLGSIEVLMSANAPVARADGKKKKVRSPVMKEIRKAFDAWWKRCNEHSENIALFYFAGHGLSTASQYLLASDFGDPKLPDLWENCVDFTSMKVGMGANKAKTQVFFVDACREKPIDALFQLNPHGNPLCSADAFQIAPRSSAYFGAADGQKAYGPPDDITYFGRAVLAALDGAGAHNNGGQWVVNTFSLGNAIGQIMTQIGDAEKQPLSCTPQPSGTSAVLHLPPAGVVMASIDCAADMAIGMQRQAVKLESAAAEKRPWSSRIAPGDWHIVVSRAAATVLELNETLMPPTYNLEVPG